MTLEQFYTFLQSVLVTIVIVVVPVLTGKAYEWLTHQTSVAKTSTQWHWVTAIVDAAIANGTLKEGETLAKSILDTLVTDLDKVLLEHHIGLSATALEALILQEVGQSWRKVIVPPQPTEPPVDTTPAVG